MGTLEGIYELMALNWCLMDWEEEPCSGSASIQKLSDSTSLAELNEYKSEWEKKEQVALRSVRVVKWGMAAALIASALLAIIWPWMFIRIWPKLRNRISKLLIVAVFVQVLLALLFTSLSGGSFIWSYPLWQLLASTAVIALGVSIVWEIMHLIRSRS